MSFASSLQISDDEFESIEAEAAERPSGGGSKFREVKYAAGQYLTYAKSGVFIYNVKTSGGAKIPKPLGSRIRGVIVAADFSFEEKSQEPGDHSRTCTPVSHTIKKPNGDVETGRGWWQSPAYDHETIFKLYDPIGQKVHPETGAPLSCQECHALGMNLVDPTKPYHFDTNKTTCGDVGQIVIWLTDTFDDETGKFVPMPEPKLFTISVARNSNDPYDYYRLKLAREQRRRPGGVITELGTKKSGNYGQFKLTLDADILDSDEDMNTLLEAAHGAYAAFNEAKDAEWQAKKAERDANGGNSRPAAGKASVTNMADKRAGAGKVVTEGIKPAASKGKAATAAAPEEEDDDSTPF